MQRAARLIGIVVAAAIVTGAVLSGCAQKSDYDVFKRAHGAIKPGMSLRAVFEAGLADYLVLMKNKKVVGVTAGEKQPVSAACKRTVLEIAYFESSLPAPFQVRVYCNMNEPSAPQLIPGQTFAKKEELLPALDGASAAWARSLEFTVESPPQSKFGAYDHFTFTTDEQGKVKTVSPVIFSLNKKK